MMANISKKIEAPNDETDPRSFRNVFKKVVSCTREHKVSESEIYHLLPAQATSWCSRKEFAKHFDDACTGEVLEGIMSTVVADAILDAIKVINGRGPIVDIKELKLGKKPEVKEVEKIALPMDVVKPAHVSLMTAWTKDNLFNIEQIRDVMLSIFDKTDLTPRQVYRAMPNKYKSPKNLAQVNGWFDGSVAGSPKELVEAFFRAAINLLEVKQAKLDEQNLPEHSI